MEKKEFLNFLKGYFKSHGFEKGKGNRYYRNSLEHEFLCEIFFYKSLYGDFYYFDCKFFLGAFKKPYIINRESHQTYTPYVGTRFVFDDKSCPAFCKYSEYSQEYFEKMLDENMNRIVHAPFFMGKKYLRENYASPQTEKKIYLTFLSEERVLPLLLDET